MKYADGQEARLGDTVKLGDGSKGVVVCSIDTDEYNAAYPKHQWKYLKQGIMVSFVKFGLVHYEQVEPDLELVERAATG